jgi:hypothetical protein
MKENNLDTINKYKNFYEKIRKLADEFSEVKNKTYRIQKSR